MHITVGLEGVRFPRIFPVDCCHLRWTLVVLAVAQLSPPSTRKRLLVVCSISLLFLLTCEGTCVELGPHWRVAALLSSPWVHLRVSKNTCRFVSQEGVPQWRCCFDDQCEAKFESFKALATHVLRHHRQVETVSGFVLTSVFGGELARSHFLLFFLEFALLFQLLLWHCLIL